MVLVKDYQKQKELYEEFVAKARPGNPEFDAMIRRIREVNPKSNLKYLKTNFWHWTIDNSADYPEMFFWATPPIYEAKSSNRILVSGTRCEVGDLNKIITGFETYQRVAEEIASRNPRQLLITQAVAPTEQERFPAIIASGLPAVQGISPVYVYSASVGSFWGNFFGKEDFMESTDKVSLPVAIVATGQMRNYNCHGGETMNVKERLEEIAGAWNIPIKFIDSWAP